MAILRNVGANPATDQPGAPFEPPAPIELAKPVADVAPEAEAVDDVAPAADVAPVPQAATPAPIAPSPPVPPAVPAGPAAVRFDPLPRLTADRRLNGEPPERLPGSYVPRASDVEAASGALQPSHYGSEPRQAGTSISLSVGAVSALSALPVRPATTGPNGDAGTSLGWPPAQPAPVAAPSAGLVDPGRIVPPGPQASTLATPPTPAMANPTGFLSTSQFGAQSFAPPQSQMPAAVPAEPAVPAVPSGIEPARKESTQELIAFGLVAAGAVLGIASLFLPWTSPHGLGIGSVSTDQGQQWGWGMRSGIPLFLLSSLALGAASGSNRARQRFPKLAFAIGRVTDLIIPMILGGLYLGIVLLYVTLPEGFESGLLLGQLSLLVGAVLLIAGAIVTSFFPPKAAEDSVGQ